SYMDTARSFEVAGAEWIHMVDLDGAKDATQQNKDIFVDVARNTGLRVEVGGGIRSLDTVEMYLSAGISRVIIGSAAVKNPQLVKDAVKEFGERIAVGIDAKNGYVATEGWLETSDVLFTVLAKEMSRIGVKYIIFTDISKDGTLSGVNAEQLEQINTSCSAEIIASGGVHTIEDIRICKKLGLYGTICGKSLYSGSLDLKEAISLAK
ncbi:MAG: 1-(5-phosphoribosyl)-5-[(5-phosphoribosylamino)methylideneamino] imidazole-4-carboxamide isomerase, partial [Oscillospiraceae bacterium]